MASPWFLPASNVYFLVIASGIAAYAAAILFTRLAGLRSFSKISSIDFAITIAIGSVIASTMTTRDPALLQGVVALALLYAVQAAVAAGRERFGWFSSIVDNEPLLLMHDGKVIEENMRKGKMTMVDLRAKLREANVVNRDHVLAVVMETTGDVSVLHGPPEEGFDEFLLEGVRTRIQ